MANIIPDGTKLYAKPTCAGPARVGQFDKFLIDWRVIEDGPYKGMNVEQALGLDEDRIDKTFETLAKLGIDESNVLTAQPTREAFITIGVREYVNKKGETVQVNLVKFFDVPRAGGLVDAGLKARLMDRLNRRKGITAKPAGVEPSPFDTAAPFAESTGGDDIPF